jgi:hypothetical protein
MAFINLTIEKVIIQNDDAEIKKLIHIHMAKTQERFDQLMNRLDTVTTDIATDYKTLLEAVQAGTVSEESLAKHEANIAKLEELGKSVDNPVPTEPPVEPPPAG